MASLVKKEFLRRKVTAVAGEEERLQAANHDEESQDFGKRGSSLFPKWQKKALNSTTGLQFSAKSNISGTGPAIKP